MLILLFDARQISARDEFICEAKNAPMGQLYFKEKSHEKRAMGKWSQSCLGFRNFWIVGAVIAVIAVMALFNLKPWEEWTNVIAGAWLFLSPWVFGYAF